MDDELRAADFDRRMKIASEALRGGMASTLVYASGLTREDIARVGGVAEVQRDLHCGSASQLRPSAKPRRGC